MAVYHQIIFLILWRSFLELDIGLIDTMKDLFVNFIGAVVFSFIGYFYVKSRGEGRFARRFIPTMKFDELKEAEEKVAKKKEKKK